MGHKYRSCKYIGRNYIGHNYIGHLKHRAPVPRMTAGSCSICRTRTSAAFCSRDGSCRPASNPSAQSMMAAGCCSHLDRSTRTQHLHGHACTCVCVGVHKSMHGCVHADALHKHVHKCVYTSLHMRCMHECMRVRVSGCVLGRMPQCMGPASVFLFHFFFGVRVGCVFLRGCGGGGGFFSS